MDATGPYEKGLAPLRRSRGLRTAVAASFAAAMAMAGFAHKAHAIPDEILFALEMGSLGIICQNHPDGTNGLLAELLAPCDFCQLNGLAGGGAGLAGRLRATRATGTRKSRRDLRPMAGRSFVPLAGSSATFTLAP